MRKSENLAMGIHFLYTLVTFILIIGMCMANCHFQVPVQVELFPETFLTPSGEKRSHCISDQLCNTTRQIHLVHLHSKYSNNITINVKASDFTGELILFLISKSQVTWNLEFSGSLAKRKHTIVVSFKSNLILSRFDSQHNVYVLTRDYKDFTDFEYFRINTLKMTSVANYVSMPLSNFLIITIPPVATCKLAHLSSLCKLEDIVLNEYSAPLSVVETRMITSSVFTSSNIIPKCLDVKKLPTVVMQLITSERISNDIFTISVPYDRSYLRVVIEANDAIKAKYIVITWIERTVNTNYNVSAWIISRNYNSSGYLKLDTSTPIYYFNEMITTRKGHDDYFLHFKMGHTPIVRDVASSLKYECNKQKMLLTVRLNATVAKMYHLSRDQFSLRQQTPACTFNESLTNRSEDWSVSVPLLKKCGTTSPISNPYSHQNNVMFHPLNSSYPPYFANALKKKMLFKGIPAMYVNCMLNDSPYPTKKIYERKTKLSIRLVNDTASFDSIKSPIYYRTPFFVKIQSEENVFTLEKCSIITRSSGNITISIGSNNPISSIYASVQRSMCNANTYILNVILHEQAIRFGNISIACSVKVCDTRRIIETTKCPDERSMLKCYRDDLYLSWVKSGQFSVTKRKALVPYITVAFVAFASFVCGVIVALMIVHFFDSYHLRYLDSDKNEQQYEEPLEDCGVTQEIEIKSTVL